MSLIRENSPRNRNFSNSVTGLLELQLLLVSLLDEFC